MTWAIRRLAEALCPGPPVAGGAGTARAAMALLLLVSWTAPAPAQQALVVHLPSSPIEGAGRQAAAVEQLAALLSTEVDGLDLEPKLFRRLGDAQAFLESSPRQAVLLITDAAWVPDLASAGFEPAFRLRRGGGDAYRRLLVVPASSAARTLADLRGGSLTVVDTTRSREAFLRQAIFAGEIDVASWFSDVATEVDDFAAVNAVLFGTSDAALAAEYNPLLASNLDRELRVIYRSPPLPLPVVSWRSAGAGALDAATRRGLEQAMEGLRSTDEGRALLGELGIDAFVRVDAGDRSRLVSLPEAADKEFEISAPSTAGGALHIEPPAPPPSGALTYRLAIELPEVELDSGP